MCGCTGRPVVMDAVIKFKVLLPNIEATLINSNNSRFFWKEHTWRLKLPHGMQKMCWRNPPKYRKDGVPTVFQDSPASASHGSSACLQTEARRSSPTYKYMGHGHTGTHTTLVLACAEEANVSWTSCSVQQGTR